MKSTRADAAISLTALAEVAEEHLESQWMSNVQARRVVGVLGSFARFSSTAERVQSPNDVSPGLARSFIEARAADGSLPTIAEQHFRRTALRIMFRVGRR